VRLLPLSNYETAFDYVYPLSLTHTYTFSVFTSINGFLSHLRVEVKSSLCRLEYDYIVSLTIGSVINHGLMRNV
jgi:hypothetical protein